MAESPRRRLDSYLVVEGIARSRGHAGELLRAGRVLVDGSPVSRPASVVTAASRVDVLGDPASDFASRAGDKLDPALSAFAAAGLAIAGRGCLDVGASTGGFTDVLLRRGATSVLAVDVGHDQLRPHLRADPRVTAIDGMDVRRLPEQARADVPADVVVADLSFISLRAVLPALAALTAPDGDLLTLVKPQFEVGRELLPRTGVVRDPAHRADALAAVGLAAARVGLGLAGALPCGRTGRTGNIEYLLWWRRDAPPAVPDELRSLGLQGEGGLQEAGGAASGTTASTATSGLDGEDRTGVVQ